MKDKQKFLVLPNGSRLRPFVIAGISVTDKGVALSSSGGTMVGFIEVEDSSRRKEIAELLDECVTVGKNFVQPDWAALGLAG